MAGFLLVCAELTSTYLHLTIVLIGRYNGFKLLKNTYNKSPNRLLRWIYNIIYIVRKYLISTQFFTVINILCNSIFIRFHVTLFKYLLKFFKVKFCI